MAALPFRSARFPVFLQVRCRRRPLRCAGRPRIFRVDDPHTLHAGLAEFALGNGGEFVEAYLIERGIGYWGFLAPAPDLVGVDVVEIGATSQLAFFEKCGDARVRRKINKNARMAVAQSGNEGAAGIFVQA